MHAFAHAPVRFALGDRVGAHALLDEARSLLTADPDTVHLRTRLKRLEADLGRGESREALLGEPLSEAEQAVLGLLGTALSRREIGAQLFLSHNTVRSHLRAIFLKLGVSSREEALALAGAAVTTGNGLTAERITPGEIAPGTTHPA
jgi:LuxR family maltose regulon positive regulatory protein